MVFNLITNLTNGAGLERDYKLLKRLIEERGHKANGFDFQSDPSICPRADVNVFLEVMVPKVMRQARQNWIVPNSEWWYGRVWDRFLSNVSQVLCKTEDCFRIWAQKVGVQKCRYIGWEANDIYLPEIERKLQFLHMAGKSETKNTAAVAEAWREFALPFPLTIVAYKPCIVRSCLGIPNVTHIERLSEEDLATKVNECQFHIIPSKYEGFGHYIHEAIGCGGLVLTTDAPPMNEFRGLNSELLIPVAKKEPRLAAAFNLVDPSAIADAVRKAASMSLDKIAWFRGHARAQFLRDRQFFREELAGVIASVH